MREIVGAICNMTVTNNPKTILLALVENQSVRFLTKQEMGFMAAMDVGLNWEKMAVGPVLFVMDENRSTGA